MVEVSNSNSSGEPELPPSKFGAGYTVGGSPTPASPAPSSYPPPAESYPSPPAFGYPDPVPAAYPAAEPVPPPPPVTAAPAPGYPPPPPVGYPYPAPRGTNSMAVAALVCSLVLGPLGIIFGHIALSQIKRTGEDGRGLAVAGLVIGYVWLAFAVLWALLVFGLWAAMVSSI